MSDAKKQYVTATGIVQAFVKDGVKQPAVRVGNANGQTVHNITIQTSTQSYVDIALWGEYEHMAAKIGEGFFVAVRGAYTQNESNGKVYHKISAYQLTVVPCVQRVEREVVNQVAQAPAPAEAVAAAPAPAAAPASANPFPSF